MSTPARILMREGDTIPPVPTNGQVILYAKTSGAFYSLNSDGVETPLGGSASSGTVTSVSATGNDGVTITGSPITTSGTFTFGLGDITPLSVSTLGTISASNFTGSSTGINTGDQTITLTGDVTGSGTGSFATALSTTGVTAGVYGSGSTVPVFTVDSKGRITNVTSASTGTVTSVALSGGTTGLTSTGGPITSSGTITLGGTLAIANGGTGQTSATGAINALLPTQTGQSGKFLTTNGTNISWVTVSGTGTVTSVSATGSNGITVSGSPITTSGTLSLGLGNITPTSVAATGTVTGSNLSGTNTGDQTITLTGDVTGSGTGSFATALSTTGVTAGVYGSSTTVPVFTVDAKGRISNVTDTPISGGGGSSNVEVVVWNFSSGGSGNFSAVDAIYSQTSGVTATVSDPTNCIATYTFTGKTRPPTSITTYGQVYSLNTFVIKDTTSLPTANVTGGGTSSAPGIISSFTSSNVLTLQTRMSDVGAAAGLGQRAWLMVVFGF